MTLTITLRPELEEWVQQEAAREGVTPDEVVARTLEARWAVANRAPRLSSRESDLLLKINEGFPEDFWQRYRELRARLDAGSLTEGERQGFIRLNDQIEQKNAERMGYLLQLAQIRGTTLPAVMKQLGIGPIQVP